MFSEAERPAEVEPPSTVTVDDASCAARVDRIMAMAHLPATAHVALIGHYTLPSLLALLRRGCSAVRCLRPGAPSPDCEAADLAWIVDVQSDQELDEALRAARARVGATGRVVVEGTGCVCRTGLASIRDRAVAAGLDVVSFDHNANRVVLAMQPRLAMAA
ncbi:MAG: hypothetical protein ACHQK9_18180 [Reyranellales bacterium]